MIISVTCHSGFRYDEKPISFDWDGRSYTIMEILAEWKSPGKHFFKVRTAQGNTIQLVYDELNDSWEMDPST